MPRRTMMLGTLMLLFLGCGGSDPVKEKAVQDYMRLIAAAQGRFMGANQTFALNMEELTAMEPKLKDAPGYTFKVGALAMSYGWKARGTPDGMGTSYFIDDTLVLRSNGWGAADENSAPVE